MKNNEFISIKNINSLKQIEIPFLVEVKNGEPVFENKTITVPAEPAKKETE